MKCSELGCEHDAKYPGASVPLCGMHRLRRWKASQTEEQREARLAANKLHAFQQWEQHEERKTWSE